MARHVQEKRNGNGVLVWKHKRKRSLRTPRHRLEKNIKIDLEATEWEIVDWIELSQSREQWRTAVKSQ